MLNIGSQNADVEESRHEADTSQFALREAARNKLIEGVLLENFKC